MLGLVDLRDHKTASVTPPPELQANGPAASRTAVSGNGDKGVKPGEAAVAVPDVPDATGTPLLSNENENFPQTIEPVGIWTAKAPEGNPGATLTITAPPSKESGLLGSFPLHTTESR
jgi:hypothetical protein